MLVFDEKKYAEDIIKNKKYNTIKNQGRERCILVRYLTYIGYDESEIRNQLSKIPMSGGEYLTSKNKELIYSKIINKANEYEFINGISINIYQCELDIIMSLEDTYARHLLFIYLVYYKWGVQVNHLRFYSKKNDIMMVIENNSDLWKLAGLSKLRVSDRYRICNMLYRKELYKIDNFKTCNYIYIPFAITGQTSKEPTITISNYSNILGEIMIYENPDEYKRCVICGEVIKKSRSPKKYCLNCGRLENIRKTKLNKKSLKTQNELAFVK